MSITRYDINGEHWYGRDGDSVRVPSVTTYLQAYPKGTEFYRWVAKYGPSAEEIKQEAGAVGSRIHHGIDCILKGWQDSVQYTVGEKMTLEAFKWWVDAYRPLVIENERALLSEKYEYGGTTDLVAEINEVGMWDSGPRLMTVIDFKTSNFIHNSYWLQLAAYERAILDEWKPSALDNTNNSLRLAILHLNRRYEPNGYKFVTRSSRPAYFQAFRAVQKVWNIDRELSA